MRSWSVVAGLAWVCLLSLALFLVAGVGSCSPVPAATPVGGDAGTAVVPPAPSEEPTVTLAPSPTDVPATATLAPSPTAIEASLPPTTELQALLEAGLAPTPTPEADVPAPAEPMEIAVLPLEVAPGQAPLWAAHTAGMGYLYPDQDHFVAVFGHDEGGWQELGRVVLTSCAEYVGKGSLTQVQVEPSQVWLELQSGAGAHSGCYDLFRFDGEALHLAASGFNSSPGAGWTADLNGDQNLEVILDQTENYVFCYACSVRLPQYQVLTWDGGDLAEVQLSSLPSSAPEDVREANDRAVELAWAQLWKDAQEVMAGAVSLASEDGDLAETVAWNAALIDLHAEARAEQARQDIFPILEQAFYGDYAAAVEPMRDYEPAEIWLVRSPLITGTVAEGWELALGDWLSWTTNLALDAVPDLAPAYFLRGWAAFLHDPAASAALDDVRRAEELEPDDELYAASAAHLQDLFAGQGQAWQPLSPEACYALGEAMMQTINITVTLATVPFQDPIGGGAGTGCQAVGTGTGLDFEAAWPVGADIAAMLQERGWTEDMAYTADGPTGSARGFRQGDALCLVHAGWEPAAEAACPADRPIFECELAPEQQLYTIWLHCATTMPTE